MGRARVTLILMLLLALPAPAWAQRRPRRYSPPPRSNSEQTGGFLFAPTLRGLPGIVWLPSAEPFEATTIGISLAGTTFREASFDGAGNDATGGDGTVAIGYTLSRQVALGAWISARGINSPTALPQPLQSGDSGLQLLVLPYAASDDRSAFRGVGLRAGVRATSGRVVVDAWGPTASPFADLIVTFKGGPMIVDATGGYLWDRSANLLEDNLIPNITDETGELDPVRRQVYNVTNGARARWGLGLQVPIARDTVRPFLEYRGIHYLQGAAGDDAQLLAGGIRFSFPLVGRLFSLTAGANAALAGTRPDLYHPRQPKVRGFFQLGVSSPPYKVTTVVEEVMVEAPPPPPPPPKDCPPAGVIEGLVRDSESGEPLDSAVVSFEGMERNRLLTDELGKFRAGGFAAGTVSVSAEIDGYDAAVQEVEVSADGTARVTLEMLATDPTIATLRGDVRSRGGEPLAARLTVRNGDDEVAAEITAAEDGTFEVEIPAGSYVVYVELAGYVPQSEDIEVGEGQLQILNILMSAVEP